MKPTADHLHERVFIKTLENIYPRSGEQRCIHLKRWILCSGTNEGHRASLYVGQKGVLLGFVKTVYLVNKQNRSPILCQVLFGKGYRSTNLFDPTEHRRQADPLAARFGGKQLGEGSFSSTRRPPKAASNEFACGQPNHPRVYRQQVGAAAQRIRSRFAVLADRLTGGDPSNWRQGRSLGLQKDQPRTTSVPLGTDSSNSDGDRF